MKFLHRLGHTLCALILCGIAALTPSGLARAQSYPDVIASTYGPMRELGSGRLRYFGFHVYDARLWSQSVPFEPDSRFALGLRYARAFPGADIAGRSEQEIRALGTASEQQLSRWLREMRRVFVNVVAGDELIGVHEPAVGARFYLNGRRLGEIADPVFARAFFAIWLDPKTSAPQLRAALLSNTR